MALDRKTQMYLDSAGEMVLSAIDVLNDTIDHVVDNGGERSSLAIRLQDIRDNARQLYDEVTDVVA